MLSEIGADSVGNMARLRRNRPGDWDFVEDYIVDSIERTDTLMDSMQEAVPVYHFPQQFKRKINREGQSLMSLAPLGLGLGGLGAAGAAGGLNDG